MDIGTGPGLLAIELAKRIPGMEVIGIDLSDAILTLAEENAKDS